jgi:uncharacterized protein (DUF427 family)
MTLTIGTAPFGPKPSGRFNFEPQPPEHLLHVEPSPRRVRVLLGGETVADSTRVQLLQPPGQTALYLFPRDVRMELLVPSERRASAPEVGEATSWTVRAGDMAAQDAAYSYESPPQEAAMVKDLIAFVWDAMDAWFEEDEEAFVHPRDPYHRIDVLRSSRHVVVRWGDTVVADSTRPRMLLETGLLVRWYLPREDVRADLRARATPRRAVRTTVWRSTGRCGTGIVSNETLCGVIPSRCTTRRRPKACSACSTSGSNLRLTAARRKPAAEAAVGRHHLPPEQAAGPPRRAVTGGDYPGLPLLRRR